MFLFGLHEAVTEFAINCSRLPAKVSRSLETSHAQIEQAKHNLMKRDNEPTKKTRSVVRLSCSISFAWEVNNFLKSLIKLRAKEIY
jgi:hypothetical protein